MDGKPVTTLGTRVNKQRAKIEVDGARVAVDPGREYLAFNKPTGIVTTAKDERGRTTVIDMLKTGSRVFPVGRLDIDTTGLLLLTNDGELAHRLAHPRFKVDRVYVAEVMGSAKAVVVERLLKGVNLEDGPARAVSARIVGTAKNRTQIEVVMREGRKREVRRMFDEVGHPVTRLVRTAYGPIRLGNLPSGQSRHLSPNEVGELQRLVDM